MHTQVVQATQASIDAVSDLKSSIYLQWVWFASNSIGATTTRQPGIKFFGVAGLIDHECLVAAMSLLYYFSKVSWGDQGRSDIVVFTTVLVLYRPVSVLWRSQNLLFTHVQVV